MNIAKSEQKYLTPEELLESNDSISDNPLVSDEDIAIKPSGIYTVPKNEVRPADIANTYGVSLYRMRLENPNLNLDYKLQKGQKVVIPERYIVKKDSVKTFDDVIRVTGVNAYYIKDILIGIEGRHQKPELVAYYDGVSSQKYPLGCPTIGFGHTRRVDGEILEPGKTKITEEKAYELLAQDIIDAKLDAMLYMGVENFNAAPPSIQTGVIDIVFNKGHAPFMKQDAPTGKLKQNLEKRDYVSAAVNTMLDTKVKGLQKRNIYRVIMSSTDLTPKEQKKVLRHIRRPYKKIAKQLRIGDKKYLDQAWENAQNGKTNGFFE